MRRRRSKRSSSTVLRGVQARPRISDGEWFKFGWKESTATVEPTLFFDENGTWHRAIDFPVNSLSPSGKPRMTSRPLLIARVHEVITFLMVTSCGG